MSSSLDHGLERGTDDDAHEQLEIQVQINTSEVQLIDRGMRTSSQELAWRLAREVDARHVDVERAQRRHPGEQRQAIEIRAARRRHAQRQRAARSSSTRAAARTRSIKPPRRIGIVLPRLVARQVEGAAVLAAGNERHRGRAVRGDVEAAATNSATGQSCRSATAVSRRKTPARRAGHADAVHARVGERVEHVPAIDLEGVEGRRRARERRGERVAGHRPSRSLGQVLAPLPLIAAPTPTGAASRARATAARRTRSRPDRQLDRRAIADRGDAADVARGRTVERDRELLPRLGAGRVDVDEAVADRRAAATG